MSRYIRVRLPADLLGETNESDSSNTQALQLVVDTDASVGVPIAVARTNPANADVLVDTLNASVAE